MHTGRFRPHRAVNRHKSENNPGKLAKKKEKEKALREDEAAIQIYKISVRSLQIFVLFVDPHSCDVLYWDGYRQEAEHSWVLA